MGIVSPYRFHYIIAQPGLKFNPYFAKILLYIDGGLCLLRKKRKPPRKKAPAFTYSNIFKFQFIEQFDRPRWGDH